MKEKKDGKRQASTDKDDMSFHIGKLLRRQRESLNISQNEIRIRLDYQYTNFISMLETGTSKIPLNRIAAVVKAYCLEPEFTMILTKALHPEIWIIICQIKETNETFNSGMSVNDIEKSINSVLKTKLRELQLPSFIV